MDNLHDAMRLDRRTPVGLESSSPPHHTASPLHQIESSYTGRNEERRVDSDTRGGGRRQNCEGDDGGDSVDRNFRGRRWSGPGGEDSVSSTPDAGGAVGGERIRRPTPSPSTTTEDASNKRKLGSTTGAGARQKKGENFEDAEVGNAAATSNPSTEMVLSSNKKRRSSSGCGQCCQERSVSNANAISNTTSLSAADDNDGTADVEGEGSITQNNDGEDSAAAAGYKSSSFSTSHDDGNSTGGRRRPLDDIGAIHRPTSRQLVRAVINDNNKFEERERQFEREYDGRGHNEAEYLSAMLSFEEEIRYYCLQNEASNDDNGSIGESIVAREIFCNSREQSREQCIELHAYLVTVTNRRGCIC